MRILVTGGSGRVGRFVVEDLVAAGHEVTSLDLRHPAQAVSGVRTILGDAARPEDAYGAITYIRAEAVVHMAAWSDPGIVADTRTYRDNTAATFNLLHVASTTAVRRFICASSAQVYGFAEHAPVYGRVDEDHPLRPLNAYALSKIASEQACSYFAERSRMNVLSFRIMAARAPEDLEHEIQLLSQRPETGRFLLWNRTDARDIALACRLALERDEVTSGIYNITAARNAVGMPSAELLRLYCPETELRDDLEGDLSILSCDKAYAAFGYRAQHL
jgi:nucleoside-diphosphate-sugar epimerase